MNSGVKLSGWHGLVFFVCVYQQISKLLCVGSVVIRKSQPFRLRLLSKPANALKSYRFCWPSTCKAPDWMFAYTYPCACVRGVRLRQR